MIMKPLQTVLACACLVACSENAPEATFTTLNSGAASLSTQAEGLDASASADIPTTGTASYSGYMGVDVGYNEVIGDLSMSVDFASDSVSGSARNFISASNIAYTGDLTLTGGFIDRTADTALGDPHLLADVDGTLTSDGIASTVDAQLRGTFQGPGRDIVSGYVSGTVTNQFGTNALNSANSFAVGDKN